MKISSYLEFLRHFFPFKLKINWLSLIHLTSFCILRNQNLKINFTVLISIVSLFLLLGEDSWKKSQYQLKSQLKCLTTYSTQSFVHSCSVSVKMFEFPVYSNILCFLNNNWFSWKSEMSYRKLTCCPWFNFCMKVVQRTLSLSLPVGLSSYGSFSEVTGTTEESRGSLSDWV